MTFLKATAAAVGERDALQRSLRFSGISNGLGKKGEGLPLGLLAKLKINLFLHACPANTSTERICTSESGIPEL